MTACASFRLFHTGLIGSVVLGLAIGGHLAGGGQLSALSVLAALCVVTMIPVAVLTRFRLSFPVLTGLIGAGQLWFHWTLNALSVGNPPAVPADLLAGHADHASHAATQVGHETLAMAAPAHAGAPDLLMFATHAVATLATALLLARGERAFEGFANWFAPLLRRPEPATILPARLPDPCFMAPFLWARPGLRLPSRRGPPVLAAA